MNYKFLIVLISLFLFSGFSGCDYKTVGPAIFNDSGGTIKTIKHYENGHRIEGTLRQADFLWGGYQVAPIVSMIVIVAETSYSIGKDELKTPMVGEKHAAFIVRSDGIHKVRLSEALEMAKKRGQTTGSGNMRSKP